MEFISLKQFEWLAHNLFGEYDASRVSYNIPVNKVLGQQVWGRGLIPTSTGASSNRNFPENVWFTILWYNQGAPAMLWKKPLGSEALSRTAGSATCRDQEARMVQQGAALGSSALEVREHTRAHVQRKHDVFRGISRKIMNSL